MTQESSAYLRQINVKTEAAKTVDSRDNEKLYLPSANEVGKGNVFTPVSVILFTG